MREVSDSLHLRRFCRIPLHERVPDESTVRKLTRRLGPETVAELSRAVIAKAQRETRFHARAVRIDSTVVEADVRYPTDAGLAGDGVRTLAREGRRLRARLSGTELRVRDRSRAVGTRVRAIGRSLRRRTGEAKGGGARTDRTNGEAACRLGQRGAHARRRGAQAGAGRRGADGAGRPPGCWRRRSGWGKLAGRAEKVVGQISKRLAGEPISESARLDLRPGRASDPQGQAGQADRVRLRRAAGRADPEHQTGSARLSPAAVLGARQPGRERAAAPDGRGAGTAPALAAGGRSRRRLPDQGNSGGARPPFPGTCLHRRTGSARLTADAATAGPLPRRRRGPDLAPEAPPRAAPQPPERQRGRAQLDRLGGVRLQRPHLRTVRVSQTDRHPKESERNQQANRHRNPKAKPLRQATSPANLAALPNDVYPGEVVKR